MRYFAGRAGWPDPTVQKRLYTSSWFSKILLSNVRSLALKVDEIQSTVDTNRAKVMDIAETWLKPSISVVGC